MIRAAAEAATSAWERAFDLASRCVPSPRRWSSPGGHRVLVVAPHPDDEAIGCAGTIGLHLRAGDFVCIVHVTDGSASRALGLDAATMRRRRQVEAEGAARLLGVQRHEWLGFRECDWSLIEASARLRAIAADVAPDLCYAPSRVDYHPEHVRTAEALAPALPEGTRVRVYPVQVPLLGAVNVVADVSSEVTRIDAVMAAYATQAASTEGAARLRRYAAALYGCGRACETFWELSSGAYRDLHARDARDTGRAWRGLRQRPWTDPLAYLRGARERGRLARSYAP